MILGRKARTNLDSILKSRDITLLTKVHVVMYGCESWTIKKAELQRIDAIELWCWRRLLSPLDSKEIQLVNPKGNQPWILVYISWKDYIYQLDITYQLEGLMLKLQYFGHLMQTADSLAKTLMLGKIEE